MCFFQESMAFTEKNHANASTTEQLCCEGSGGSEACLHGKSEMREIRRKRV